MIDASRVDLTAPLGAPEGAMRTIVSVPIGDISLVRDPAHPLYDPRVELALDEFQLAGFRVKGQKTPIQLVTRENLAELGIEIDSPYTPRDGRRRRQYCEAAGIEFMDAIVVHVSSLEEFLTDSLEDNTHREEESTEHAIQKATRILAAGASLESISRSMKKPVSTVRILLKIGDETGTVVAPEVREMIRNGEMDMGSADQLVGLSIEEQKAVVQELIPVQVEALSKGETKKGDPALLVKNDKGETVAKPTQDTVQVAKAKVKNRPKPKSVKPEKAPSVPLDLKLVETKLGYVQLMRRCTVADASFIAGFEAALCSLTGKEPALPEHASYEQVFRVVFPKKEG